mgnify:CR=1 FL=1
MADREREKKKKRAYLDDFEKDLNGNYQYRGAHYRYAGEHPPVSYTHLTLPTT